jgi:curved DNA-binding protein CbpA
MDPQFMIEAEALAQALDELDYFQVLKLTPEASLSDVKAAYYRESRAYHPDRYAASGDDSFKVTVSQIYKRVNEAYLILRDEKKRQKYIADIQGPDRAKKLRFTQADEVAVKEAEKKKVEEQFGLTPNGRKFYITAMKDIEAGRWDQAIRNLKSALMYEPANTKFKEQLAFAEKSMPKVDQFKIK